MEDRWWVLYHRAMRRTQAGRAQGQYLPQRGEIFRQASASGRRNDNTTSGHDEVRGVQCGFRFMVETQMIRGVTRSMHDSQPVVPGRHEITIAQEG